MRVRLDDADLLSGGAVTRDGVLYVPAAFAALVGQSVTAEAPPALVKGLTDRWVSTVPRPAVTAPTGVRTTTVRGATWYALADVATARGLKVAQDGRGLVAAGATARPSAERSTQQYEQSKLQMPSGLRLIPRERPRDRRDTTGYTSRLSRQCRE